MRLSVKIWMEAYAFYGAYASNLDWCKFYHESIILDAFLTNSRNIIGRNPSMVIPLLANQDLMPMFFMCRERFSWKPLRLPDA